VAWLEPEAVKQLNMVAIQRDTEVQKILVEAINDWSLAMVYQGSTRHPD
jgi:hypothetical protein